MMSEPKGRGGKKPKYQIADIGGADLTAEDISTERVLNFLIKGERADEQGSLPAPPEPEREQSTSSTNIDQGALLPEKSGAPDSTVPDRPAKKSLNHLFERAGSGSSGPVKDLKLKLSEPEPQTVPSPVPPLERQVVAPEPHNDAAGAGEITPTEVAAKPGLQRVYVPGEMASGTLSEQLSESSAESTQPSAQAVDPREIKPVEASAKLAQYLELWKNFYRLKVGEIEVLSAMFRMSHDQGRSECYIKMRKLAEMSHLDYRYCQKVVRSLERLGWITKLQDYDATTQLGVLYRVNLKPGQLL